MRKHIQQTTRDEKAFIHGFIRANADKAWSCNGHFSDRATERAFTLDDAKACVKGGLVVEVHNDKNPDVRALLRNSVGTCVVVSLKSWEIITVYYNDPTDEHHSLNWNAYRWPVNLVSLVKDLRRAA